MSRAADLLAAAKGVAARRETLPRTLEAQIRAELRRLLVSVDLHEGTPRWEGQLEELRVAAAALELVRKYNAATRPELRSA